jgi:hypothetical protein
MTSKHSGYYSLFTGIMMVIQDSRGKFKRVYAPDQTGAEHLRISFQAASKSLLCDRADHWSWHQGIDD